MSLPVMTPEQRASALEKAALVRKERADLKGRLKDGTVTLAEALDAAGSSEVIARIRVSELLRALPGVGKATALQAMEEAGVAQGRRLRGLGAAQRAALLEKLAPAGA